MRMNCGGSGLKDIMWRLITALVENITKLGALCLNILEYSSLVMYSTKYRNTDFSWEPKQKYFK